MTFEDWIENADKDIGSAMGKDMHNHMLFRDHSHKAFLFPFYIQYSIWKSNRLLVFATWGLAVSSIILSLITIYS